MEKKGKADGLKEVAQEVIGLEHNKIFATVKYLTISPSQVISEFCSGEKHKYLSPVVYFLGVQTIKLYLSSISGLSDFIQKRNVENVFKWMGSIFPSDTANKNEMDGAVHNLSSFLSFFMTEIGQQIIGLPILLLLTWLFYKRFNKSFKENSWFALYIWSHASLLSLPIILTFFVTNDVTIYAPLTVLLSVLYWTWVSTKFYQLKFGKALILRVLMWLSYSVTIGITSVIFSRVIRLFTN